MIAVHIVLLQHNTFIEKNLSFQTLSQTDITTMNSYCKTARLRDSYPFMGGFDVDTVTHRMDSKDSMQPNPHRIPSILFEFMIRNRQQEQHQIKKGVYNNTTSAINHQNRDSSVCDIYADPTMRWMVESYTNEEIYSRCDSSTKIRSKNRQSTDGMYRSAARPIIRSEQETLQQRMEEKAIHAAEHEYDQATWRMYNRIMRYRQRHPLPERITEESTNATTLNEDITASDRTATTTSTGTNSTHTTPSNSPKFAPIPRRNKTHYNTTENNDNNDDDGDENQFNASDLPRIVSDNNDRFMLDDCHNDDVGYEYDEYTEMMMFDLEL